MSDFFTHLAGQVIRPSTDVIPDIPVRFAPGANVPGSELAPEPPVLDTLFQPAPAAPADRMGAEQSSTTAVNPPVIPKALAAGVVRPNPAVTGAKTLPDHAKAEKDYPTAGKGPGFENAAPALTSAPHETRPIALPIALPAEGNELPRGSARPSDAQPTARLDPPGNAPPVHSAQPSADADPSIVLPIIKPAGRPESPVAQPLSASAAADPEGPGTTERFSMPIVRPAGSLSPLELLEPPVAQPSSPVPGPDLSDARAPVSSISQHQPLAALQAGEIALPSQAKSEAKISTVAFQPLPPQKSQQAASNSLPEILPLVKPAAAQKIPPPTVASPEVRHTAAEAADPQIKAALPAAVISPQTPAADRLEPILAAALSHADTSRQQQSAPRAKRAQAQPAQSPAAPPPAPIPAIDPGPMDAAGLAVPAGQRPPGTSDPRPASKPEMAAEQPPFSLEFNPKSLIRPLLGAESSPDSTAPSRRSGTEETTIPTLHLTIGRIVVKTVPPAAPAAPRPAPIRRQPAISLHDYLNRHGSGK